MNSLTVSRIRHSTISTVLWRSAVQQFRTALDSRLDHRKAFRGTFVRHSHLYTRSDLFVGQLAHSSAQKTVKHSIAKEIVTVS